jgi:exopolyphosphatase/guanosine-5'-triphosphate,3'-diphosphate pyrophosphatase
VLKLAALMRLADALDDDRLQRVERVEVELTPEVLRIFAETRAGDREGFSSIAESFRVKADLFGETFGLEPTLTEVLAR